MSIPSINISSLLQAMGGNSGIDVTSTVTQLITAKRVPELQWQDEITSLQTQTSLLNQFSSATSTLEDKLSALSDPTGALTSMKATSSNTSLVSASADPGTVAGNHVVVVKSLAKTASWYSDPVASSTTALTAGSFKLAVGGGDATLITIGSGVNTLDQLVTYLNTNDLGVNASVVNDASGARLAIVSKTSGEAGDIAITEPTNVVFTQAVEGKNASLTVDGIPISSASNSVTGAVNGLTLNLLGADENSEVNVGITNDSDAAVQAVQDFVSVYNSLINGVNAQFKYNGDKKTSGPLAGDMTMRLLQDALLGISGYTSGDENTVNNLGALGITMGNDGTLTVDTSQLTTAIQGHFSDVQKFFQGENGDGFAATLKDQLTVLTDATKGAFVVDLKSNSAQQSNLQDQIDDFEIYITAEQTRLTELYNNVNIQLQQLPLQIKQLQAALGNDQWGNAK